ncbi:MAG: DUF692 family protein [Deltaproteobacteria bacterium]|nr:DUF692 family protein [Deltaproteobacteria bacterium]
MDAAPLLALPVLGVGLSTSFGVEPEPLALARQPGGPAFVEYAGPVHLGAVREGVEQLAALGLPALYHPSALNLCGPWPNPPAWVRAVAAHARAVGSPWLAQDVAVCFSTPAGGYSVQLGYFVPPVFTEAGLDEAVARVTEARAGLDRPLLLEPAPLSFCAGPLHPLDWLAQLAARTGCGLLLDAGHLLSILMARRAAGAPPERIEEALARLPMDRVIELHVAGGAVEEVDGHALYVDQHELPALPETWAVARAVLQRAPALRAVCVEVEGMAAPMVLAALDRARQEVVLHAIHDELRRKVRAEQQGVRGLPSAPPLPAAEPPAQPPSAPPASAPSPSAPPPAAESAHPALLRLLLDPAARADWAADPLAWCSAVPGAGPLATVHVGGLAHDAALRARYLMSALCRPFPLSAAAAALRSGADALRSFLADPAAVGEPGARTRAFALHLGRLLAAPAAHPRADPRLDLDQEAVIDLLDAVLALEAGAVEGAAALRAAHQAGPPAPPPPPRTGPLPDDARPVLPEHLRACLLPQPPAALRAALDGIDASDAWARIEAGALRPGRLLAVARAAPQPVTVLLRTVVQRWSPAPDPALPPLIEVGHRSAELRGNQGRLLGDLDGHLPLLELSPRQRGLVEALVRGGLLELAPIPGA